MMRSILLILVVLFTVSSCKIKNIKADSEENQLLYTNTQKKGTPLKILFKKGKSHNYPSFAIWMEDTTGKYIETLYVTKSVGTGMFNYGETAQGKWHPSQKRYPASLPYWAHKRGIKASDGLYIPDSTSKVPDAITGATPRTNFELHTTISNSNYKKFKILLEINQTWDFNEYWTNNKFPDNEAYKKSCQPALIYETIVDLNKTIKEFTLHPVGHSHYAGENGDIYYDLSTITTALDIISELTVYLNNID